MHILHLSWVHLLGVTEYKEQNGDQGAQFIIEGFWVMLLNFYFSKEMWEGEWPRGAMRGPCIECASKMCEEYALSREPGLLSPPPRSVPGSKAGVEKSFTCSEL